MRPRSIRSAGRGVVRCATRQPPTRCGDPASRVVPVYLPPGYDDAVSTRYPVVFCLTGFTGRGVTLGMVDAGFFPHPDLARPRNRIRAWADAGHAPVVSRRFLPRPGRHGAHAIFRLRFQDDAPQTHR